MEARIEFVGSGHDSIMNSVTTKIVIAWEDEERGFGQITIWQESYLGEEDESVDTNITIDSEYMSEDFVKSVLNALVNHAQFEHWKE